MEDADNNAIVEHQAASAGSAGEGYAASMASEDHGTSAERKWTVEAPGNNVIEKETPAASISGGESYTGSRKGEDLGELVERKWNEALKGVATKSWRGVQQVAMRAMVGNGNKALSLAEAERLAKEYELNRQRRPEVLPPQTLAQEATPPLVREPEAAPPKTPKDEECMKPKMTTNPDLITCKVPPDGYVAYELKRRSFQNMNNQPQPV